MTGAICGITTGIISYIFGCHRTKKKYENEKKELLRYIKLQNDLYDVAEQRWKEEYDELYTSYLSLKTNTEERDYGMSTSLFFYNCSLTDDISPSLLSDEFKAPDTDGDDRVSRQEVKSSLKILKMSLNRIIYSCDQFDTYIAKYLSSFPELSNKDFPKFGEFDTDESGHVTFQEWQKYIDMQKELEARKAAAGSNDAYNELLEVLNSDDKTARSKGQSGESTPKL